MKYLYLDTSNSLTLGLLDDNFSWIEYQEIETKRTSDIVHGEILSLLSKQDLTFKDIDAVIVMAGPGSYTGMRVSEGMAQVLEMEELKVFSFHSFRIPEFLNIKDSIWVYPAFKGEVFKLEEGVKSLISVAEFNDEKESLKERLVTHGTSNLSDDCKVDTAALLKENPSEIMNMVVNGNLRDAPYYFRALDVEFKKSLK